LHDHEGPGIPAPFLIAQRSRQRCAKELGYDSSPMDGIDYQAVAVIVQLPSDYEIAFMIAIGKGTKDAWPKPGQLSLDKVMVKDRFDGCRKGDGVL